MRAVFLFFIIAVVNAHAQWITESYALKGGWNAIYLHGDATHDTPAGLFASGDGLNIEEVWRWNPNPNQVQFTTSPQLPSPGTPEWSLLNNEQVGLTRFAASVRDIKLFLRTYSHSGN
jgi:hypothetical protein